MNDSEQTRIFAHNLQKYVDLSGKTQKEIAKELDFPIQSFNGWCKGIAFPRMDKVQKIADYFHIGKSDLLDDKPFDCDYILTDDEKVLIANYRHLTDPEKDMLQRVAAYSKIITEDTHGNR